MAGILTFSKSEITRLVEETEKASSHRVAYTGGDWGAPLETTPD